ncbi:MAG TPA: hypothetical protein VG345_16675 [Bryobacteraceae bacterium]|nr:hypothetical protein [Bryobacteraceae bacterium]
MILRPGGLGAFFPNAMAISPPSVMIDRDAANPGWKSWGSGLNAAPRIYYPADAALQLRTNRGQGLGAGTSVPTGSIDTIGTQPGYPNTINVTGWAADPVYGSPVSQVLITADGSVIGSATLGQARPDLAASRADWGNAGFSFQGDISGLPNGNHTIGATAVNRDGTQRELPLTAGVNAQVETNSAAASSGSYVSTATASTAAVAPASWFSDSTSLFGLTVPNVALLGGGALFAFMLLKRR